MKIVLIGPGLMPIPSTGWGAVERIIWDYYQVLSNMGYDVHIVNTSNHNEIISQCNALEPDIAHIMYDDHIQTANGILAPKILYTSHFAYLTHPEFPSKYSGYFYHIFQQVIQQRENTRLFINAISPQIRNLYIRYGFPSERVRVIRNGARDDLYRFTVEPTKGDRSIYLGKVEYRKAQYKYQSLPNMDFIGNYHDSPFNTTSLCYKGEWSKDRLYQEMTDYGNLVLLSAGEADPLVVKEALIAGLGVVISECSAANLDLTQPWITVIPNTELDNLEYVADAIRKNREIAIKNRDEIRKYGLSLFGWSQILKEYLACC
jgi:glycosyltransferase involved in cell wall biosynthesis